MKKIANNKKGFTIIEVVLVLAIAGLIFMMVFIALPALQRSQRDTQRSNDISRVVTALQNYQGSNRGAIPTTGTYVKGHVTPASTAVTKDSVKSWDYFYDSYLIVNSGGAQDTFADPDGESYSLWIQPCGVTSKKTTEPCVAGQRFTVAFDDQAAGTIGSKNEANAGTESSAISASTTSASGATAGHSISIITNATCQGEVAYYSTGARKVAVLYKKEGGGTFCVNN